MTNHQLNHSNPTVSPLNLLYEAYSEERPLETPLLRSMFRELDCYLKPLPMEEQEEVFRIFCQLYSENERFAFQSGVRIGMLLGWEAIMEPTT